MATLTLIQAVAQEQQAQQRERDAGSEVQQRERELAALNRAFAGAGTDPQELARLVSQRDGLELAVDRLRTRARDLAHLHGRAATVLGDVQRQVVGLQHLTEDSEAEVQRAAALVAEAEGELASRRRRHAAAVERLAERRAHLAALTAAE